VIAQPPVSVGPAPALTLLVLAAGLRQPLSAKATAWARVALLRAKVEVHATAPALWYSASLRSMAAPAPLYTSAL